MLGQVARATLGRKLKSKNAKLKMKIKLEYLSDGDVVRDA
jgi:hypothetical protein